MIVVPGIADIAFKALNTRKALSAAIPGIVFSALANWRISISAYLLIIRNVLNRDINLSIEFKFFNYKKLFVF